MSANSFAPKSGYGGRWNEEQLDGNSSVWFYFAARHSLSLLHCCGTSERIMCILASILCVAAKVNMLWLEDMTLK